MSEARGFLALLLACGILLGLSTCQRQGESLKQPVWNSPVRPYSPLVQQQQQQQQQQRPLSNADLILEQQPQSDVSLEYEYTDEVYEDEEELPPPESVEREPKLVKPAPQPNLSQENLNQQVGANGSDTFYDDSYFDDEEEVNYETSQSDEEREGTGNNPEVKSQPGLPNQVAEQQLVRQQSQEELEEPPKSSVASSQDGHSANEQLETEQEEEDEERRAEVEQSSPVVTVSTSSVRPTERVESAKNEESAVKPKVLKEIVSVVTTKSVVNGTYSVPEVTTSSTPLTSTQPSVTHDESEVEDEEEEEEQVASTDAVEISSDFESAVTSSTAASATSTTTITTTTTTTTTTTPSTTTTTTTTTTEFPPSSTIQPSVQTGRSVSGARYLPFPSVIDKSEQLDSTESIIDKLDRVQSELSSGFLAQGRFVPRRYNKKPFSPTSLTIPTSSTTQAPTSSPIALLNITSITKRPKIQTTLDDIAAFLPKDYVKGRNLTTTIAPPVITKRPKYQTTLDDVDAFLPKDFPKSGYRSASSTTKRPKFQTTLDDVEAFLPKDFPKFRGGYKRPSYKTSTTLSSSTSTSTGTRAPVTDAAPSTEKTAASTRPKTLTTIEDISAFLPPGYKLKKEDATTEKSVILSEILAKSKSSDSKEGATISSSTTERAKSIQDLFAKSAVDISALLPPGYKPETEKTAVKDEQPSKNAGNPVDELLVKSSVDIKALLPTGFDETSGSQTTEQPSASTDSNSPVKVVFPSRPGGRKPVHKITTPPSGRGAGPDTPTPRIQKGWPSRATTEFTGWPTSSTTPISIEKLLEAARTATVSSTNVSQLPTTSEPSSTSSTTTTTTTTLRPTTPGICDEECEVAGTIKIVENATWVPELLDRNTHEWQDLAEEIEREMNLVFAKSPVLRKWFRNIRIDSFSQGSILVDYFVELADLKEKINTQQLKVIFHDSLRTFNYDNPMEATPKGPVKLGRFTIEPKSTDFVVIPRVTAPKLSQDDDRLIPQWAIAMMVIGVGGLLFTIVFGVSVLVNRQHGSKLKPSISAIYEEEVSKNAMSHAGTTASRPPASDYHRHDSQTMWNDPGWHDKPFESTSHKILVDGLPYERKYNMYDSWKSEWNGYYYPPTQASGSNFSRHHSDYDLNF